MDPRYGLNGGQRWTTVDNGGNFYQNAQNEVRSTNFVLSTRFWIYSNIFEWYSAATKVSTTHDSYQPKRTATERFEQDTDFEFGKALTKAGKKCPKGSELLVNNLQSGLN